MGEATEVALRTLAEKIGLPQYASMAKALGMLSRQARATFCNDYWQREFSRVRLPCDAASWWGLIYGWAGWMTREVWEGLREPVRNLDGGFGGAGTELGAAAEAAVGACECKHVLAGHWSGWWGWLLMRSLSLTLQVVQGIPR